MSTTLNQGDKILLTGHKGRIGAYVAALLIEQGFNVVGYDLPEHDILDLARLTTAAEGCTAIVHLAGKLGLYDDHMGRLITNVMGTVNACDAGKAAGIKRFIYMSSANVLGIFMGRQPPDYFPVDDAHPVFPWRSYATSKLMAETAVAAFANDTGMASISLRAPALIEPGDYAEKAKKWQQAEQDIARRKQASAVELIIEAEDWLSDKSLHDMWFVLQDNGRPVANQSPVEKQVFDLKFAALTQELNNARLANDEILKKQLLQNLLFKKSFKDLFVEYGIFIDVRDAAGAILAALIKPDLIGHHNLLIAADNAMTTRPVQELADILLPDVGWREKSTHTIKCDNAKAILGWQPKHGAAEWENCLPEMLSDSPTIKQFGHCL